MNEIKIEHIEDGFKQIEKAYVRDRDLKWRDLSVQLQIQAIQHNSMLCVKKYNNLLQKYNKLKRIKNE